MTLPRLVPVPKIDDRSDDELHRRAQEFYKMMQRRRTYRNFSDRPVAREIIEYCIQSAGTAPSGANLQPWHFVAVSEPAVKHEIRIAAEKEEKEFYAHRDRHTRYGGAFVRIGFTDAYAESDGVSESRSRTAVIRETFCAFGGWSSRARSARHIYEAGRDKKILSTSEKVVPAGNNSP
jgi:nitroreductase